MFASVEEGKQVLGTRDELVERMSPFDRAARLQTDRAVSEKQYLAFAAGAVRAWSAEEKRRLTEAFDRLQPALTGLGLSFPKRVLVIKTSGAEEGGAAYTRANAVILPVPFLAQPDGELRRTIAHELFHVVTRNDAKLRERAYAAIGFHACEEVAFPPTLRQRKITNPDAPRNDHYVQVAVRGKATLVVPILFSRTETYDVRRGGPFFAYLDFRLLVVEASKDGKRVKPVYDGKEPRMLHPQQVTGFFEQVGRNTQYIIHPEEILADNFALLVTGSQRVASPEVLQKLKKAISAG